MHIEILVQNPSHLKEITSKNFDFSQVGNFQFEAEEGELEILDIPYFNVCISNSNTKLIFIAFEDTKVVGALCIEYCERGWNFGPNKWAMMNIGVNDNFTNKGYSSLMIESMFKTMNELELSGLLQSSYTDEGNQKIKKVFNRFSYQYPSVKFVDSDSVF